MAIVGGFRGSRLCVPVPDSVESRFSQTLKRLHLLQLFAVGNEADAIDVTDLTQPIAHLRCAEFFRVEGGQITTIRLVFQAIAHNTKA